MRDLAHDLRTWRFWRWFLIQTFSAVGVLAVLLELTNFIFGSLPIEGWPLAIIIAVVSIGYGLVRAWPRPIRQDYNSPNTMIEIVKGDLFAQDSNIVVGTCDTFDTSVPNIIAKNSVQGQALERLYGGDTDQLDRELAAALQGKTVKATIQKHGKTEKYGVGAVATLRNGSHRLYFLAYSEMNEANEAQSTPDGIWRSLASLWEEVSRTANGTAVAVPVIGGGQSRLSQVMPAQDSIRFIVMSFMFASRTKKVCDQLRIVVHPRDFDRLDRLELQAFLSSMRPS
ncbi:MULTISPECIES: macro domain-containing protein [Microbacteriaceae]|jgi:hypothetical protein|uniref:macro domain-containing protein n=1 Tax=Microbacteriaceae TaxID=85023 RepID=UPI0003FA8086|nr:MULTISPECIES: macro domain-containing protein [Microbacteriaceae]